MNPEEISELRELIEFLRENKVGEFDLERGGLKVRLKFAQEGSADLSALSRLLTSASATAPTAAAPVALHAPIAAPAPAPSLEPAPPSAAAPSALQQVKSPIVGTFYESPSPGTPPFVKIGDQVEVGQVLCIVEAMKLMNEIESDVAGEVVERLVQNGQPVEYGQPLFAVRPR